VTVKAAAVTPPDAADTAPSSSSVYRAVARFIAGTRFVIVAAIVCTLVGAIVLSAAGVLITINTVFEFALHRVQSPEDLTHLLVACIEIVDVILVAVVLYMISIGFYTLFIDPNLPVPAWLAPHDIDDLKLRLVAVVNAALGVLFMGRAVAWTGGSEILPYGVAIAAVIIALTYFMSAHASRHRGSH
jgi:uncharacterized membrane protein YqhA